MIEFLLTKHPAGISNMAGFDKQTRLRRDKGRYFISLDPKSHVDVMQFFILFQESCLEFNGHTSKQLAAFDPAFDEPEGRAILEKIRSLKELLPKLTAEADSARATAEVMKAATDEGTDLANIDALIAELNAKRKAAEAAEAKAQTARRRLAALDKKLQEAVAKRRKQAAEALKRRLEAAADQFNKSIVSVYEKFWSEAEDLFSRIAELTLTSCAPFPPEIYSQSFVMNLADARKLKQLMSCPQIGIEPDKLVWDMKPIKDGPCMEEDK